MKSIFFCKGIIFPTEESKQTSVICLKNLFSLKEKRACGNADHDLGKFLKQHDTEKMITSDKWEFPYTRQKAAFPLEFVRENKFWPTVRRIDEAFGDRNLICSCTSIDSFVKS